MAIITGVSTADEFLDAINNKGASLTNESTADNLLEAINATGGNISFQSPNGVVIQAVNDESYKFVDWEPSEPADTLLFKTPIIIKHDEEPYQSLYDSIVTYFTQYTSQELQIDISNSFDTIGHIEFTMDGDALNIKMDIDNSVDNGFDISANWLTNNYKEDQFVLTAGHYTLYGDGGSTIKDGDITNGTMIKLPCAIEFESSSTSAFSDFFSLFIKVPAEGD